MTEEIFQEIYHDAPSIHTTEIRPLDRDYAQEVKYGNQMLEIVSLARGAKTNHNVSLKTPIKQLTLAVNEAFRKAMEEAIKDLKATLFIENLTLEASDQIFEMEEMTLDLER